MGQHLCILLLKQAMLMLFSCWLKPGPTRIIIQQMGQRLASCCWSRPCWCRSVVGWSRCQQGSSQYSIWGNTFASCFWSRPMLMLFSCWLNRCQQGSSQYSKWGNTFASCFWSRPCWCCSVVGWSRCQQGSSQYSKWGNAYDWRCWLKPGPTRINLRLATGQPLWIWQLKKAIMTLFGFCLQSKLPAFFLSAIRQRPIWHEWNVKEKGKKSSVFRSTQQYPTTIELRGTYIHLPMPKQIAQRCSECILQSFCS